MLRFFQCDSASDFGDTRLRPSNRHNRAFTTRKSLHARGTQAH